MARQSADVFKFCHVLAGGRVSGVLRLRPGRIALIISILFVL